MTALTLRSLLERTKMELEALRDRYAALTRETSDPLRASLGDFLSWRELQTVTVLEKYLEHDDEERPEFAVHVRLGHGFPFDGSLSNPVDADLDQLLSLAEATDDALEHLMERVRLYTAGERVGAALEALDAIVRDRRAQLGRVAQEIEGFEPSPGA